MKKFEYLLLGGLMAFAIIHLWVAYNDTLVYKDVDSEPISSHSEVFVAVVIVEHSREDEKPLWAEFKATSDYELLQELLYHEARGESLEGKKEVVRVVLNRAKSENFPDTIEGVIFQPQQFCPAQVLGKVDLDAEYLAEIERAIYEVLTEDGSENKGSLFFMNPVYAGQVSRSWFSRLTHVKTIDNHEFYK